MHVRRLKEAFFLVFIVAVILVTLAPVFAFEDPHKGTGYPADTDACARCHRSHTAASRYLAIPLYDKDRCFTCHDGTGSDLLTSVEFSQGYRHSLDGLDSGSGKQCANCHETHLVEDTSSALLVNPRNTRQTWSIIESVTAAGYDTMTASDATSVASGLYLWCERCHEDSATETVGYSLIDAAIGGDAYVPYSVGVVWKTSRMTVDDSGTTSGYWDYFRAAAYNDPSDAGDAHGRDESTSTTMSWKGPYEAGYPAMPCTDCHENHGTSQPWIIADSITVDTVTTGSYDMRTAGGQLKFCTTCHDRGTDTREGKCTDCHRHGDRF